MSPSVLVREAVVCADDAQVFRLLARLREGDGRVTVDVGKLRLNAPEGGLDEAELLQDARGPRLPHDRAACLHDLVSASAAAFPGEVAVRSESDSLTYSELEARPNQLANLLVARGVGDAVVGILLERDIDAPITLAAVLKTGAESLLLDVTHPPSRLQATIRHSQAACVTTRSSFATALSSVAPTIELDWEQKEIADRFVPIPLGCGASAATEGVGCPSGRSARICDRFEPCSRAGGKAVAWLN